MPLSGVPPAATGRVRKEGVFSCLKRLAPARPAQRPWLPLSVGLGAGTRGDQEDVPERRDP